MGSVRRRLSNGRDYVYSFYANRPSGSLIEIMQVSADGTAGRICAVVGAEKDPAGYFKWAPYSGVDSDGDGFIAEEEIVRIPDTFIISLFLSTGIWVDDAGNILYEGSYELDNIGSPSALLELPLAAPEFDALGNPLYDWNNVFVRVPKDTSEVGFEPTNVRVQPDTGDIYRLGGSAAAKTGGLWMGGTTVERIPPTGDPFWLYVSSSDSDPLFQCNDTTRPESCVSSFATAPGGNYFYTALSAGTQVLVKMYTGDGLVVASGSVGPQNGAMSGLVDTTLGITALRAAGEHYVYTEDGIHGRMIRRKVEGMDTIDRFDNYTFSWSP
jgi:hypothetical protein